MQGQVFCLLCQGFGFNTNPDGPLNKTIQLFIYNLSEQGESYSALVPRGYGDWPAANQPTTKENYSFLCSVWSSG